MTTWSKQYLTDGRIKYTRGEYTIMQGNAKNIFTGRVMSSQGWRIYKNGAKIDFARTLKEAKAIAQEEN